MIHLLLRKQKCMSMILIRLWPDQEDRAELLKYDRFLLERFKEERMLFIW